MHSADGGIPGRVGSNSAHLPPCRAATRVFSLESIIYKSSEPPPHLLRPNQPPSVAAEKVSPPSLLSAAYSPATARFGPLGNRSPPSFSIDPSCGGQGFLPPRIAAGVVFVAGGVKPGGRRVEDITAIHGVARPLIHARSVRRRKGCLIAASCVGNPSPHGGRGALPSEGGSPSDLLFLAGGGPSSLLYC